MFRCIKSCKFYFTDNTHSNPAITGDLSHRGTLIEVGMDFLGNGNRMDGNMEKPFVFGFLDKVWLNTDENGELQLADGLDEFFEVL